MAKSKMRNCKSCNAEISAKGKVVCPNCGAVNKKPFYKRFWFILLVVIIILSAIGSCGGENASESSTTADSTKTDASQTNENNTTVEEPREAIAVTVDQLYEELESNALKASNTYDNAYVELTGKLSVIDASGKYFALSPMNNDFSISSVRCDISKEHIDKVANFEDGQTVTVLGTITSVGEILGYSLDVEVIVTDTLESDTSSDASSSNTDSSELMIVTTDDMIDLLSENALKASQTYKGKYVEITGELSVIDASGDYFSLSPMNDDFSFVNVLCYIEDEHLDAVMEFTDGQEVTVIGTVKDVGEILGYSVDVETIK